MDVIGDAGFGMEVDAQRNPNEPFIKSCREIFDLVEKRSIFFTLSGEVTINWLTISLYVFLLVVSTSLRLLFCVVCRMSTHISAGDLYDVCYVFHLVGVWLCVVASSAS